MFQCPHCQNSLIIKNNQATCSNNHTFDQAKSGYYNFLIKSQRSFKGDHPSMILARRDFLNQNHYKPLIEEIQALLSPLKPKNLLDAGCGEGYYTNFLQNHMTFCTFFAFDISKDAVDKCARKNHEIHTFVSSVNSIPIQSGSMDIILSMFAPIDFDEFSRVISNQGYLLVASAHPNHLLELKELTYEKVKIHTPIHLKDPRFNIIETKDISFIMSLQQPDITNLFLMTPYSFRTRQEDKQKVFDKASLNITAHFTLTLLKRV